MAKEIDIETIFVESQHLPAVADAVYANTHKRKFNIVKGKITAEKLTHTDQYIYV